MINFIKWIMDAIRTDLFYRFGIGGRKMPPDMLEFVRKWEEEHSDDYTKENK